MAMLSISSVSENRKGVLRISNDRDKEKSRPRCSVAFCETVEFRTVYVTKQERLGQFYDLNPWDFVHEDDQEYTQNIIADFAATCIPLKDSEESNNSRKIKRLFWNYDDESSNNFTISWINSFSNKENNFNSELEQEYLDQELNDGYSDGFQYNQHDISFEELNCEELNCDTNDYVDQEEINISINYE